ncbi:MAG: ubiquinol-cytochrome c reductase cytochrome c subunit [Pseudonocardiales bacterium]|jgi:ubiquinol-cytochrome c reductase cytochrome c subunit|nr:ubiquinol-cytochrome c reductase cytochrome c subunit [Pseudonocardiales bacterium]
MSSDTPDGRLGPTGSNLPRATGPKTQRGGHSRLRRKLSAMLALAVALLSAGALYVVFAPQAQTARAQEDPALVRQGEQLYNNACISCHGMNLQGVNARGPSLIGVGEAAVYFQVSTGRMPASRQEAQIAEKPVRFTPQEIDALGAFVQANGGGPIVPKDSLAGGDVARGGDLFRLNCASCHNFTGRGIALSSGKYAPAIQGVNAQQIYSAMTTGPQSMPRFSDRQLTPEDKKDIIAYLQSDRNNPGGYSLGGFGPVPEGLISWIVGITALVGVTLWIGSKA